ncbi:MAG: LPS export ABC transporter periplasmic protein LptC [Alphaproteobacteria bacterium]|nr:LPS export ABC transporter periplasmic protein LptC [Alphaproteobacteria bacterium]MBU1549295.1 LPS export ABC transporter periplasmic protein LptC [Alphaproteobacteria bacterium]MBU2338376.1 LPS export ABC transporter periplasmic protein LptC [Alphaproteobacteria bacterium]MBU2388586.1 LPS export ABC transporter periplasmic protein LptC [Alphaproteobacteria bacterium]|tara:strand:+ start:4224 stop:4892 length:669 start_codon:yes stop_codon:yes gene_type:complete
MLQRLLKSPVQAFAGPADGDAYQAALRHSARVRRLRIWLPITAGLISAVFIGVSVIRAYLPEDLSIESARIEDGKIVMERPAIAGRNDDGISYSMTAVRALQDIANPNMITLEDVKAAVPVNEDTIARVVATAGIFDRGTDRMQLTAPFDVNLSNGTTAKFQSADLDVVNGTLDTADPVAITTEQASIVAQSLKIADKGKTITFAGQVRVNIDATAIRNQGN